MLEMAQWIKGFVPEIPVQLVKAEEPLWGPAPARRRRFLETTALALPALASTGWTRVAADGSVDASVAADLVIVGGSVGGCAAALAACRAGLRVILTEETDWVGGQLTSQAVPPDEHPWIESFGCTRSYRAVPRAASATTTATTIPLTAAARSNVLFNPGNGGVSRLCHEPRVALAVLEQMLAPYVSAGRLRVLLEHEPVAADVDGDRVRAVTVRDRATGRRDASWPRRIFIDATELGDLLPLTRDRVRHRLPNRDATPASRTRRRRPIRWTSRRSRGASPWTTCAGEDHTIDRPAEYAFWRDYVPEMTPAWPGVS